MCGRAPIEARRGPHPMKLELETVVSYPTWGLGSELKSSGKGSKHFLTAESSLQPLGIFRASFSSLVCCLY